MALTPGHLIAQTLNYLPFSPTDEQTAVIKALCHYAISHLYGDVIVLNGHAGTGKTSVMGAVVAAMTHYGMKTKILAPTGRAAKVAERFAGKQASTIHRHIYRLDMSEGVPKYHIGYNNSVDTLYIVDEASMITNSGREPLLQQLIGYVRQGKGCGLVLVGDTAQLPPVGYEGAPAMDENILKRLGLAPLMLHLKEPARQTADSGILLNAVEVRRRIKNPKMPIPTLVTKGLPDISVVSNRDLADTLSSSWSTVGRDQTIIITRSNIRANRINTAVRQQVMYADSPIESGERLVIAKNNYFWTKEVKGVSFLANGETIVVDWVGRTEKRFGRRYLDIEFHIAGREETIAAKLMLRSLVTEGPSIPRAEAEQLTEMAMKEYTGSYTEVLAAIDADPHYNALQAKYAYCVTCHKAQGGQWQHVYIDLSGIGPDAFDETYYRWLYTALTRATDKVYLVAPSVPTDAEEEW